MRPNVLRVKRLRTSQEEGATLKGVNKQYEFEEKRQQCWIFSGGGIQPQSRPFGFGTRQNSAQQSIAVSIVCPSAVWHQ